ncbi:acetylesterase [Sporanaerobium hydrogeniformans]|uniref:Acetylesterase n=1 Tax=Sporanaerobium hydrogeniformans TaxID=3072179 RepID=A0AC61DAJ5_9FIRM|nr:alpha/beta hydrolase [Sporanaerobium hydrogeniformans]PHV70306.1 acetylesterase [Sporanaerobium hydrogeniformans]
MLYREIEMKVDYKKVQAIHDNYQPKLIAYLLESSKEIKLPRKRPAVIVCPGGAYRFKSDREGEPIAMRFLAAGMQAFVLQYSVAPSRYPSALLELAKAVAVVREHASEWDIDPNRIFVCGFSAGGHLCASLGTLWNEPFLKDSLGTEEKMWKPNGMILCYPVITTGEYTHEESCQLLLGPEATSEARKSLSLETRVTKETIPCFIWHTAEDTAVPVENALLLTMALRKHSVPFELHIYEIGEHGLALCDETTMDIPEQVQPDNANWIQLAIQWIRRF